jgi:hypothetical protein
MITVPMARPELLCTGTLGHPSREVSLAARFLKTNRTRPGGARSLPSSSQGQNPHFKQIRQLYNVFMSRGKSEDCFLLSENQLNMDQRP